MLFGEFEQLIADTSRLEFADLDGRMEDAQLDAYADGIARLLVEKHTSFLDTTDALFGLEGDGIAVLRVLDAVVIVVGRELEFGSVFVTLVRVSIIDGDCFFLALQTIVGDVVVPCNIFLVDKLAFLAFGPDGAFGLIDANDVDGIVKL